METSSSQFVRKVNGPYEKNASKKQVTLKNPIDLCRHMSDVIRMQIFS